MFNSDILIPRHEPRKWERNIFKAVWNQTWEFQFQARETDRSVSVKRSSPFTTGCINTPEPIQTGLSLQNTYISTWTEYDAVYKEIQTALPVAFVLMSRQRGINYLALTDPNIWTRLWDSNTFQNVRIIKIFKTLTQWEQLMRQERKVLLTHTYKRASLFSRLHKRAAMTLGDVWKKMERDYSQMEAVDSK